MFDPIGVLHIIDCLNIGGTERQMFELLRRINRERYLPLLACFKAGGHFARALAEIGIDPIEVPLKGALFQPNTLVQIRRLREICRARGVRILHAHDFYSNVLAVATAKSAGMRVIVSRRDLSHWLSPVKRRALRLACLFADRVLANANAVGDRFVTTEGGSREKLRVIPNGIDVDRFDRQLLAPLEDSVLEKRDPHTARLITVASMNLCDKGHGDLLKAARILNERGRSFEWICVGDGTLRASLAATASRESLNVRFVGRREDVPSLLKQSDLLVHPSWAEGFPNAILEGMCAALPVVATRVGGAPELVNEGETGLLVNPKQPEALARAIDQLLADGTTARAMGRRGRERIESRYTVERMAASVESLYDELLMPI